MQIKVHPADTRGQVDFGWLQSRHTFSFGHYYDPERVHFGALRVINDDTVAGGKGFGMHHHDNMEIISIPLSGDLEHKDSMGNQTVIRSGDIQVMSAGTGIHHSEYNKNKDIPVKFLQIWVLPDKENVKPRYDQITLDTATLNNQLTQVLSPDAGDAGVWIHQQAWFHLGRFDRPFTLSYPLKKKGNGVYIFILSGDLSLNGRTYHQRDGLGITGTDEVEISSTGPAEFLVMEVPMLG